MTLKSVSLRWMARFRRNRPWFQDHDPEKPASSVTALDSQLRPSSHHYLKPFKQTCQAIFSSMWLKCHHRKSPVEWLKSVFTIMNHTELANLHVCCKVWRAWLNRIDFLGFGRCDCYETISVRISVVLSLWARMLFEWNVWKQKKRASCMGWLSYEFGVPKGIRTPVAGVKGLCPRPG